MSYHLIYITAADKTQAISLGKQLVQEKLVACANIMDSITSIYEWQGKLEQNSEAVIISKTRTSLVEAVTARVKELHSYDCPCVVAVPIEGGNNAFLEWVFANTQTAK